MGRFYIRQHVFEQRVQHEWNKGYFVNIKHLVKKINYCLWFAKISNCNIVKTCHKCWNESKRSVLSLPFKWSSIFVAILNHSRTIMDSIYSFHNNSRFNIRCYRYGKIKCYLGPSWSWSYCSWIYNYLCNQFLSPLKLSVRTPFMTRCTRYNNMWWLSVSCGRYFEDIKRVIRIRK
jgi:hypothetical protein